MSINPSKGVIPPNVCVSRRPSNHKTILQKPEHGDLTACANYAHEAVTHSSKPFHILAFIWVRFLKASYLQVNTTTAIPAEVSSCK